MGKPYTVNITNGTGTANVLNDSYNVSANVPGFDASSLNPASIVVNDETNTFDFTISASGALTLHVTEEGTSGGTPVVGAVFYRTDSTGTTISDAFTTDSSGNITMEHLPYLASGAPTIYYKQTASDGSHTFDDTVKSITLTSATTTVEVTNAVPPVRTFNIKDAYYQNSVITTGTLTLS